MMRFVDDEKIEIDVRNVSSAQRFERAERNQSFGHLRGAGPHFLEHRGRNDQNSRIPAWQCQRNEGFPGSDRIAQKRAAKLIDRLAKPSDRGDLVGLENDSAEVDQSA